MAQRIVEMLIGRLITDEQFRTEFLSDPNGTLTAMCGRGLELTQTELTAIVATDRDLWADAAERIDPRLQKASLLTLFNDTQESEHHV